MSRHVDKTRRVALKFAGPAVWLNASTTLRESSSESDSEWCTRMPLESSMRFSSVRRWIRCNSASFPASVLPEPLSPTHVMVATTPCSACRAAASASPKRCSSPSPWSSSSSLATLALRCAAEVRSLSAQPFRSGRPGFTLRSTRSFNQV